VAHRCRYILIGKLSSLRGSGGDSKVLALSVNAAPFIQIFVTRVVYRICTSWLAHVGRDGWITSRTTSLATVREIRREYVFLSGSCLFYQDEIVAVAVAVSGEGSSIFSNVIPRTFPAGGTLFVDLIRCMTTGERDLLVPVPHIDHQNIQVLWGSLRF
jgi:hypothetical protein